MKILTRLLFALLLLTSVNSAFAGIEDRHISGFKGIHLSGSFDVQITQGSTESVKVEAPDNMMERIRTEVVDGVLKIYSKRDSEWNFSWFGNHKKVVIHVVAKDLNSIGVSGSGDIFFKEGIRTGSLKLSVTGSGDMYGRVEARDLEASISGSGDLHLSGRALTSKVSVVGSGDFIARDLVTSSTSIHISGSGDASINASEKIEASVSGSGDIRYSGGAKNVSSSSSGSGSIHRSF